MGIDEVIIDSVSIDTEKSALVLSGSGFTKWSRVYVNNTKIKTTYISGECLSIALKHVSDGDVITVSQVGSSNSIFRTSNEVIYNELSLYDTEESEITEEPLE